MLTLHDPHGSGRRTAITDDFIIKPPKSCEVVLQTRTREILSIVKRFKTKKAECEEAYQRLREQLGAPLHPIDLWNRKDVPNLDVFRTAYRTRLQCQEANDDVPPWSHDLRSDHLVRSFLKSVECDWQAQRVWPYASLWGLCAIPENPEMGYERFFERWPQWRVEKADLDTGKAWQALEKKLKDALAGNRLAEPLLAVLGDSLTDEIEGRLQYTLAQDYQTRHGGVLRTTDELNRFAEYTRPEIVRYFGMHYDPAKHTKDE